MKKSRKFAKKPTGTSALDEIKSMADVVRSIQDDLIVLKFSAATRQDLEPIKTELRLVRSDLAALEKRLPTAEPAAEAKLPA